MAFEQRVESIILHYLTSEWYLAQRARFESEHGYESESDTIKRQENITFWGVDSEGNDVQGPLEVIDKRINFNEYAWDDEMRDLTEPLPSNDIHSHRTPIDASHVATKIINYMVEVLSAADSVTKYKGLKKAEEVVTEAINQLKKTTSIPHDFLEYFESQSVSELWIFNSKTVEQYRLSDAPEVLHFDLNQDQLAALVYLLSETGLIDNIDNKTAKSHFYNFCQRHFYCLKKGSKEFSQVLHLAKKVSDIKKGETLKPFDEVFERLKYGYDQTIKTYK
jgi:hypothetical protein